MALRFLFDEGGAMPVKEGLPAGFDGTIFRGAQPSHIEVPFATIVNQEYNNLYLSVSECTIIWKQSKRVIIEYDFMPGLFSRICLDNPIHEWIKGAGEVHLGKDQFSLLAGSTWKSFILPEKPGKHTFLNLSWSEQCISEIIRGDVELMTNMKRSIAGLPIRFIDPPNFTSIAMKQLQYEMMQLNLGGRKNIELLQNLVKKYCIALMNERNNDDEYKRETSKKDWDRIRTARKLIEDNLDIPVTTRDMSKAIDMDESKLKRLFLKLTGFSLEEYRKYKLIVRQAGRIIRQPDERLKSFYPDSGYSSMANFTRGCLKHCCCIPSQLRTKEWNVKGLSEELIVLL